MSTLLKVAPSEQLLSGRKSAAEALDLSPERSTCSSNRENCTQFGSVAGCLLLRSLCGASLVLIV